MEYTNQDFHGYQRSPIPPTPGNNECLVREQDRFIPISNVTQIMRKILPANAKITNDSKQIIQECVSEFIAFVTSEANDRCQREHRKTVTAEDILWAMCHLGFDDYIEPLTIYLNRYRANREIDGGECEPAIKVTELQFSQFGINEHGCEMDHHLFDSNTAVVGLMNESPNVGPSGAVTRIGPYAQSNE